MPKPPALRCGDCLQFNHDTGQCGWLIKECRGASTTFASECALWTTQSGKMPRLDSDDEQMELIPYESILANADNEF